MKKNINITKATVIEAHGTHTNGNCKSIVCLEKRKVYTSMTDTAADLGCSLDAVSNVIRGKQKTCKGYHLFLLSEVNEYLPMLFAQNSNFDEYRAKAKAYDKLMAKQEAERKAEERVQKRKEKHEAKKAKLMFEIDKHKSKAEKFYAKAEAHTRMQMKAEQKFEALMDKEVK